jgi:hypothetical protein
MRRLSSGARRNELEGARPAPWAPMFSAVLLFDGAIVISAPTLPGTKSVRCHQAVSPSHLCLEFHRRPPFLAGAKPDSQSNTFRARLLPLPTDKPSHTPLMAISTTRRPPLFPPAIFCLKDSINPIFPHASITMTPAINDCPSLVRHFHRHRSVAVSRTFAQEPTPGSECLSDRGDHGHQ